MESNTTPKEPTTPQQEPVLLIIIPDHSRQLKATYSGSLKDSNDVTEKGMETAADTFAGFGYKLEFLAVGLDNYAEMISDYIKNNGSDNVTFLSLCDGSEADGRPGMSIRKFLDDNHLRRVGNSYDLLKVNSDKREMKEKFLEHNIPTARYVDIRSWNEVEQENVKNLRFPVIIKSAHYYCSLGIDQRSVCLTFEDVAREAPRIIAEWGSIFIEEFITGPEFTVLLVDRGSENDELVIHPAERAFVDDIPPLKRIVLFDAWYYDDNNKRPYSIKLCAPEKVDKLVNVSRAAYRAVNGCGHSRVDIREDEKTGEVFVLEVNSNPNLSKESHAAEMLRLLGLSLRDFTTEMLKYPRV